MNILIIIPDYPPDEVGGTELFTRDLAENLAKTHQVTVLTTGEKVIEEKGNLTIVRTKKLFKNRYLYNIQETIFFIKKALFYRPDIIIGHMLTSAGLAAILAGKLSHKPVVVRLSGSELRFPKIVQYLYLKPLLKLADGVITINSNMERDVKSIASPKQTLTLPQGVTFTKYTDAPSEVNKKPRILCVSRFMPFKNLSMLMNVAKAIPEFDFVLIGDGPEKEALQEMSPSNVIFKGVMPHNKVIREMKKSDVFVLTSTREPFGRVLLEAMACGLPIVATSVGGPNDVIADNRNGYLVKVNDIENMATKIRIAIKNKQRIGKNNLLDIEHYSWDNFLKKYVGFYEKCLKKYKPSIWGCRRHFIQGRKIKNG